jgi:hypothetical protein
MPSPRFRIYYGPDSDYATYEGDPFFAPPADVQVIVQEGRKAPMSGKDAYYWKPASGWHSCDRLGMWDYLFSYKGPKAMLFGRETERDQDFFDLLRRAKEEGLG